MKNIHILWVDDEIELLSPYMIFLREKGYQVSSANNGHRAIELVSQNNYDIILLDENMPGISGLETLTELKKAKPNIPVVMVTKSEEENIMDQAIGSKIADYLIKPVNPNQILLVIKKNTEKNRLVSENTTQQYQQAFNKLSQEIAFTNDFEGWKEIYRKLVFWELELQESNDPYVDEILAQQKNEVNNNFAKWVKRGYSTWFEAGNKEKPLISPMVFQQKVYPTLDKYGKAFLILIDNLRYDQWHALSAALKNFFHVVDDDLYCSILPTSTQYSRNAMFAGLMPSEINKLFPDIWLNDEEEGGKNLHEEELLRKQHLRFGRKESMTYIKALHNRDGKRVVENFSQIVQNDFVVLVYNFVDILSHARTEMEMMKELAEDEKAYRSLTLSWFDNSPLFEIMQMIAQKNIPLIITTDHGCIRVQNPVKVVGDRNTTTNIRYKQGRNLNYNPKEVFEITDPLKVHLPKTNISSTYIFTTGNDFFVYPNNLNQFVKYYKNTFQHGGISLEEMLVPIATLLPNK